MRTRTLDDCEYTNVMYRRYIAQMERDNDGDDGDINTDYIVVTNMSNGLQLTAFGC